MKLVEELLLIILDSPLFHMLKYLFDECRFGQSGKYGSEDSAVLLVLKMSHHLSHLFGHEGSSEPFEHALSLDSDLLLLLHRLDLLFLESRHLEPNQGLPRRILEIKRVSFLLGRRREHIFYDLLLQGIKIDPLQVHVRLQFDI